MTRTSTGRIARVELRDVRMPLREPYPSAIATIVALETLVVEISFEDGRAGFGEAAIVEGYTHETRDGGWRFCEEHARIAPGCDSAELKAMLLRHRAEHSHAVSALVSAMEMAEGHRLLAPAAVPRRVPLLAPVNAKAPERVHAEVERLLSEGFRTLKVKVGFDVAADLSRVELIRQAVAGRAMLRLDGNQGYTREQAIAFVDRLPSEGIELLEQPCADRDWDAAAAVARAARVPMMLDESIYASADIDRAGDLRAADYIKLKLVKAGGLDALVADLERVTARGMRRVLGNGVASEIGCWMEACVAHGMIDNAGELNGFLKPEGRLFADPLPFDRGDLVLPADYLPSLDRAALDRVTVRAAAYAASALAKEAT